MNKIWNRVFYPNFINYNYFFLMNRCIICSKIYYLFTSHTYKCKWGRSRPIFQVKWKTFIILYLLFVSSTKNLYISETMLQKKWTQYSILSDVWTSEQQAGLECRGCGFEITEPTHINFDLGRLTAKEEKNLIQLWNLFDTYLFLI